jgi:hypothetical protein
MPGCYTAFPIPQNELAPLRENRAKPLGTKTFTPANKPFADTNPHRGDVSPTQPMRSIGFFFWLSMLLRQRADSPGGHWRPAQRRRLILGGASRRNAGSIGLLSWEDCAVGRW